MTARDGGNAIGLFGTTLAHCKMFTEHPGVSSQWVPAVRRFGQARHDDFYSFLSLLKNQVSYMN